MIASGIFPRKLAVVLAFASVLALPSLWITAAADSRDYAAPARRHRVSPVILEGICRFETDNGRIKVNHNKNGSWDVGLCQNNRPKKTKKPPKVPSDQASINEGAKELAYWKKYHTHFCVQTLKKRGACGYMKWGKWRGIKNCRRNHAWFGHYNWGFRVSKNGYDKKVRCFIDKGYKKCKKREWRKVSF